MAKIIRLVEETIQKKQLNQLSKWILSGSQLTKSKETLLFEQNFSKFLKTKYSVFVNSGSSANLLIASSLLQSDRLANKIIILPAVSWITTVMPFIQLGYKPIFCDCNLTNLGLDLNHLKKIVNQYKPSTLVICNVLGHSNDMSQIIQICKKNKIFLIEDNCESLGSEYKNKKLGSFGLASSHSFYYGHHMSTIEGGMVSTNDNQLKNIMLSVRSHGWSRDLDLKEALKIQKKNNIDEFRNLYTFYYSGFNLRSTDLNAKLGNLQLQSIHSKIKKRNANFQYYQKKLSNYWSQESNHTYVSNFAYASLVQNPIEVFNHLKKNKIESRPLICGNIARHPVMKNSVKNKLPNADIIHDYGIYLPNHDLLSKKDIDIIVEVFQSIAKPYLP